MSYYPARVALTLDQPWISPLRPSFRHNLRILSEYYPCIWVNRDASLELTANFGLYFLRFQCRIYKDGFAENGGVRHEERVAIESQTPSIGHKLQLHRRRRRRSLLSWMVHQGTPRRDGVDRWRPSVVTSSTFWIACISFLMRWSTQGGQRSAEGAQFHRNFIDNHHRRSRRTPIPKISASPEIKVPPFTSELFALSILSNRLCLAPPDDTQRGPPSAHR